MDYLVSDLYCTINLEAARGILRTLVDLDEQQGSASLSYPKLYDDKRIHNVLKINWLSNKLFGVYLSKIHVIKILKTTTIDIGFKPLVDIFIKHFKFMQLFSTQAVAQLEPEFSIYQSKLTGNYNFVKNELYTILSYRFGKRVTDITNNTLLTEYVKLASINPISYFESNKHRVLKDNLYKQCVITGVILNQEHSASYFDECETFTYIDGLLWQMMENPFLLRILLQKRVTLFSKEVHSDVVIDLFNKVEMKNRIFITETRVLDNIRHVGDKISLIHHVLPRSIVPHVDYVDDEFIRSKLYLDQSTLLHPSIIANAYEDYCKGSISYNKYIYQLYIKYLKKNASWNYCESKSSNINKAVVIIDNRANPLTAISCYITGANLRKDLWNLVIYTSKKAKPYYVDFFKNHLSSIVIDDSHPRLNVADVEIEDYNFVLKDSRIWKDLITRGFEKVLLIQDDGMIVRPGVEDFVEKYDYVGAPWSDNPILHDKANPQKVGNGGLSVRNVQMHYTVTEEDTDDEKMTLYNNDLQPIPEDVYFSKAIYKRKGKIPSTMEASKFSSEQVLNMNSLGFHKFWAYNHQHLVESYFKDLMK